MMDIQIRLASVEDTTTIVHFGARAFREAFSAQNDPADMEAYLSASFRQAVIRAQLLDPATLCLLAVQRDELMGYSMLRSNAAPDCVVGADPIELVRIYADPDHKGEGIGSILMRASLRQAAGRAFRTIWLGVWERNEAAIGFYRKWGFSKVGTQRFELGTDIQTDLVMVRQVQPGPFTLTEN